MKNIIITDKKKIRSWLSSYLLSDNDKEYMQEQTKLNFDDFLNNVKELEVKPSGLVWALIGNTYHEVANEKYLYNELKNYQSIK